MWGMGESEPTGGSELKFRNVCHLRKKQETEENREVIHA